MSNGIGDVWVIAFSYDKDDYDDKQKFPTELVENYDYLVRSLGPECLQIVRAYKSSETLSPIPNSMRDLDVASLGFVNDSYVTFWIIYRPLMIQRTDAGYEQIWQYIQDATEWGAEVTAFGPINKSGTPIVMQSMASKEFDDDGYFENPGDDDNYKETTFFPKAVQRALSSLKGKE
jgi:hypothetical protein